MFDKFVRDKLNDHQSTVPAGVWEKIEQRKDKGRRGGFLSGSALLAGVLFLATVSGTCYVVLHENEGKAREAFIESSSGDNVPDRLKTNSKTDNSTGLTTSLDTSNSVKGGQAGAKNDNIVATTVSGTTPTDHGQVTMANRLGTAEKLNNSAGLPNRSTRFSQDKSTRYNANDRLYAGKDKNTYTTLDLQSQQNGIETGISFGSLKPHVSFSKGKTAYHSFSPGSNFDKNHNLSKLKIDGIDCPPNGRAPRKDWFIEIFGSPDLVLKSVKAKTNAGYVSRKDSSETPQLSYSAGFRISRSIANDLLLKTGLQYSQINERFDLRTENERRITTVITIRTIIGQGGADSTVRDTASMEQVGYRVQRTYNRYRSLDIPVLLSYEFGNENLKFALNAGAIINLHSWYSGNTLNDSFAVVPINSKPSGIYKQNIGVGLYGGFSVIKPLSNGFNLFLEPYFRYNLSNMSRSAGYSQRFNAAGLSFGIRYQINRQRSGVN